MFVKNECGLSLSIERFECKETKSGRVQISEEGKTVVRLSGKETQLFLIKIAIRDARGRQVLMAIASGHFKHASERGSKPCEMLSSPSDDRPVALVRL